MFVATREFVDAAKAQAKGLGADPAGIFVDHPIQDRTDEEMVALAEKALAAIEASLLDGGR